MKIWKTLEPDNQFKINCPVFNAETRIAGCFLLQHLVYRGEGPPDKRQGCQCAMAASKCPIPAIVTKLVRVQDDPYHSDEPKLGKIQHDILDKIAPIVVPESQMTRFSLSPNEEKALRQANEDARSGKRMVSKAPRRQERVMEDVTMPLAATRDADAMLSKSETTDALIEAAKSGDMSAAINTAAPAGE